MTNSIIIIRGNYIYNLSEIFECFKYNDLDQDSAFSNAEEFNNYLLENYLVFANQEIALRGIWLENGWTIICDPEMVDTVDDEALLRLSKKLNCEVYTFIIQTTSGSFGFAKYENIKQRHFLCSDSNVIVDFGSTLKEEQALNFNEKIFVDDILMLANNLGVDLTGKKAKAFIVKELGYSGEMKKELIQYKQDNTKTLKEIQKPWWRIMVK